MFEVDTKGFAELHAGRPPWHFARELIANSFDEQITFCHVWLRKDGNKPAILTVADDGPGFAKLRDAYTLFGHTPKRGEPTARGRFNLGDKELAAIAKKMTIHTMSGTVEFGTDRKLYKWPKRKRAIGTQIEAHLSWTKDEVAEVLKMLNMFIPPVGIKFSVNDEVYDDFRVDPVETRSVTGKLATTIFSNGAMRPTVRTTEIKFHEKQPLHTEERQAWLYEMGIPVQPIEGPYHVNVMQKIPLSPNREGASDAYLQDIYAFELEETAASLSDEEVSQPWVRIATEDDLVTDETVQTIRDKRYEDAVLWSSDLEANQRALEDGKDVIHPRTMSPIERGRMVDVGMTHSSASYGIAGRAIDPISDTEWTHQMVGLANLSQYLFKELYGESLVVNFINEPHNNMRAGFRNNQLVFNQSQFKAGEMRDRNIPFLLALLGHEFGHRDGAVHDGGWINSALEATARIIKIAMARPQDMTVGS